MAFVVYEQLNRRTHAMCHAHHELERGKMRVTVAACGPRGHLSTAHAGSSVAPAMIYEVTIRNADTYTNLLAALRALPNAHVEIVCGGETPYIRVDFLRELAGDPAGTYEAVQRLLHAAAGK
jgi:hypothetical protein